VCLVNPRALEPDLDCGPFVNVADDRVDCVSRAASRGSYTVNKDKSVFAVIVKFTDRFVHGPTSRLSWRDPIGIGTVLEAPYGRERAAPKRFTHEADGWTVGTAVAAYLGWQVETDTSESYASIGLTFKNGQRRVMICTESPRFFIGTTNKRAGRHISRDRAATQDMFRRNDEKTRAIAQTAR